MWQTERQTRYITGTHEDKGVPGSNPAQYSALSCKPIALAKKHQHHTEAKTTLTTEKNDIRCEFLTYTYSSMEHYKPKYRHKEKQQHICTAQLGLYRNSPPQKKAVSLWLSFVQPHLGVLVFITICLVISNALNTQVTTTPHGEL